MNFKKYFIVFTVTIFALFFSYSTNLESFYSFSYIDEEIYQELKSLDAKNRIKNLIINKSNSYILKTSYHFDKNGNIIKFEIIDHRSPKTPFVHTIEYNEKNEIIKFKRDFSGSENQFEEHLEIIFKREYNQFGKITKLSTSSTTIIVNKNNKEQIIEWQEYASYIYDNVKIKEVITTIDSIRSLCKKIVEKYDNNENTIEKLSYDKEDNLISENYYTYDNKGNLIKEKYIQFKKTYMIDEYEYNEDKKIIKSIHSTNGKITRIEKHEYNDKGLKSKSFSYDGNEELKFVDEYEYIFNKNNEIIKGSHKYGWPKQNKFNTQIYEYQYEYY